MLYALAALAWMLCADMCRGRLLEFAVTQDGSELADGTVILNGNDVAMGFHPNKVNAGKQLAAFRFANVDIPKGAKISKVELFFTAATSSNSTGGYFVQCQDDGDSKEFLNTARNLSSRNRTGNAFGYYPETFVQSTVYTTKSFSTIVQEVVNHPLWESGNALTFIFSSLEKDPSLFGRSVVSVNAGVGLTRLQVTFADPTARPTSQPTQPTQSPTQSPTPITPAPMVSIPTVPPAPANVATNIGAIAGGATACVLVFCLGSVIYVRRQIRNRESVGPLSSPRSPKSFSNFESVGSKSYSTLDSVGSTVYDYQVQPEVHLHGNNNVREASRAVPMVDGFVYDPEGRTQFNSVVLRSLPGDE